MSLRLVIGTKDLTTLIAAPPQISDSADSVCRTLSLSLFGADLNDLYLGQPVSFYVNDKRWFFGFVFTREYSRTSKSVAVTVYDPLYYWKQNEGDYYVKNMTMTQTFRYLAEKVGTKVYSLSNTGNVFKALYYETAVPDKIAVDLLARNYGATGIKHWFRYQPDEKAEGLILFERKVPSMVWAFQVGVNLTEATLKESIEDTKTIVKLVNRETGLTVIRYNKDALYQFGPLTSFEEVDAEASALQVKMAEKKLKDMCRVGVEMSVSGVNPDVKMPQFFSGDVIYVEESYTGIIGAKYIKNVSHSFESDNRILLSMDVVEAPEVPELQYEDATEDPNKEKETTKKTTTSSSMTKEKKKSTVEKKKEAEKDKKKKSEPKTKTTKTKKKESAASKRKRVIPKTNSGSVAITTERRQPGYGVQEDADYKKLLDGVINKLK